MAETQMAVMKYQARDGQTITLSFETIRNYLVQGKAELVTQSEFMYFMGVCKSQGMNPFKRDCYLIKYDHTPAAIITSIHFLRSRAKAMTDCVGWEAGIIVLRNKEVVYSNGLMLENDVLLGGWARGKPKGWDKERHHEVNLKGYIKRRKDGNITKFWEEENQPSQIAKVAEGQLVRAIWPEEFQNLYTDAEISPDDDTKLLSGKEIKPDEEGEDLTDAIIQFDASIPKDVDLETVQKYLAASSKHFNTSVHEIKANAAENLDSFWQAFRDWAEKHQPAKEDSIRKIYKGLGNRNFKAFMKSCLNDLPTYPQVNQDEIEASWKKRFKDEPYPGSGEATVEVDPKGSHIDLTEGTPDNDPPNEGEDKKFMRLVDGAEENVSGLILECPETDKGIRVLRAKCEGNCNGRPGCPSWAEYDKE